MVPSQLVRKVIIIHNAFQNLGLKYYLCNTNVEAKILNEKRSLKK